jgi:hypothetical protein
VSVTNTPLQAFQASLLTYDKALYDESKRNVWPGPVSLALGRVSSTAAVLLPPWSMSVLELKPAAAPAPGPGKPKLRQESHPGRTD